MRNYLPLMSFRGWKPRNLWGRWPANHGWGDFSLL